MKLFYKNKNVLVTGGTGLIGTQLVNKLVKLKSRVIVASLDKNIELPKGVKFIRSDLRFFENCLKIQPHYSFAVNNIEHVGDVCAKKGNSDIAIRAYTLLTVHTPKNFRIFLKLGQVYGKDLGDNETALRNFLEANKLQPNNIEVLNKLGIVYSMTGRNNEAIEAFNKVIEQQPENANTLINIGITYTNMGFPEMAEPIIQKASSIDPSLKR